MQKKLIALAVAGLVAAPAFAQSNVTISGIAAVSYTNSKQTNGNPLAATENRLDDQTSRFTLKGTEDLGNGLSAYFQIENRVSLDSRPNAAFGNAQGLADGESFVGIKHKDLGQIGLGKFALHYHETFGYSEGYRALNTQNYSTDLMSSISGFAFIAANSRSQNTIKYDTPTIAGFSGKVAYSFNPLGNEGTLNFGNTGYATLNAAAVAADKDFNKGGALNVAARYFQNGINAYVSYWDYDAEGAARAGQRSTKIGGDYTFAFGLRAGLHFDQSKIVNVTSNLDLKRTAWMIPVAYTFGANTVHFNYVKANDTKVGGVKATNSGATKVVLAYDRALSKRTFVGVSYMKLDNKANGLYTPWLAGISTLGGSATLVPGADNRQFSVNVTHFF